MPPARAPRPPAAKLEIHPATPARFADLERLFGPRGACAGCWCMWWRVPRAEFEAGKGEGNRRALAAYVAAGHVAGLLAYDGAVPVGWVAVEPRAAYPRLARSRNLAPVDARPVWSITCFFVARSHRRRGVTRALVEAAAAHARAHGAPAIEAYPVDSSARLGDAFLYTGAASTFEALGFEEVARRSPTRPVVRLELSARRAPAARDRARARSTGRSSPTRPSGARRGR
ncbi:MULTISPECIES: GNAT family N-acetyltransferase [Anaeromyxobacter]|uniref:GNAT family N-acetyltransferase n=1 Tax=Anaeromyxobacter TaxID=161492 RepID=UPI001F593E5E|nr:MULTISPECIES: GNAT family N-acetyltransferase [unclassified Anaeromyxobacter]